MSYAASSALQSGVYQQLLAAPAVSALVNDAIYDAVPSGKVPDLYVSLGPETARDTSDALQSGAEHVFVISVVSQVASFQSAKEVAAAICDALIDAPLSLSRGTLTGLWFVKAKAGRSGKGDDRRRIDLSFRARIDGV